MASDLVSLMQREREKYREQRDRARTELEEAERLLTKIDAFLEGEARSAESEKAKGTGIRTRKSKEQTAKVRHDILDAVRQNATEGVPAKSFYGILEPHGYKRSAINAALFALSKEDALQQSGRRTPYKPGPRFNEALAAASAPGAEQQAGATSEEAA